MWRQSKFYSGRSRMKNLNQLLNNPREITISASNLSPQSKNHVDKVLPKETRVVICGGGVVGAAVAYHLAQMGWGPQTILVEGGRFNKFILD